MTSVVWSRPSFADGEIRAELRKICLVDAILSKFGALEFEVLFKTIQDVTKDPPFKSIVDLMDFILARTNAFDVTYGIVKNCSLEFREMFGYVVNYLCNERPENRSIAVIQKAVDQFKSVRAFEIGKTEDEFFNFIKKHSNFFILHDNFPSILNPACVKIPSAWERCALPVYSSKKIRYDKSIVLETIGEVVVASPDTHYVKIRIVKGRWSGQNIYAVSDCLNSFENVALKFPRGTIVKVSAYRSYNAKLPWTAFSVISNVDEVTEDDEKKKAVLCVKGSFEETSSNGFQFAESLVRSELLRIKEIDGAIGNGEKMSCEDIFQSEIERTTFTMHSHLKNFIYSRPHLYEVSKDIVVKRSERYRDEVLRFIRYVDKFKHDRLTISNLRKKIMDDEISFGEISLFAKRAADFKRFIKILYPLFEVVEHYGEEYIWLRGTYVPKLNIFIPYFIFDPDVGSCSLEC